MQNGYLKFNVHSYCAVARLAKMPGESETNRAKIKQFMSITGTSDAEAAETLLQNNGWNVEAALECLISVVVEEEHGAADPYD